MSSLVISGQRVLLPEGVRPASLLIEQGRIAAVGRPGQFTAARSIDAGALLVCPGIVDSHVHINEPGRTEWEGFRSAKHGAADGGITTVVDMPINCIPATVNAAAAHEKQRALAGQQYVDVAFWGGVVPGNAADLAGLAKFGVAGCKCFLCPSGVDEFQNVQRDDLEKALPVLRDLGLTLLVHAEVPGPLERADAELAASHADPRTYDTYLRSRPNAAEDEAIALVIELCRKHNARAHIVHLASASAIPLIEKAQRDGVQISAETCLHYLTFSADEIGAGQTHYKCAPPSRDAKNREGLWQGLQSGVISMVVSDHSPCTPQLKKLEAGDFMGAWGGISSLQLGLSALFTLVKSRGLTVEHMWRWNAKNTAKLAGVAGRKGEFVVGADADVVIWSDTESFVVEGPKLHHRHPVTPYAGRTLFGVVHQTLLRGEPIFTRAEGLAAAPRGQFVSARS